ncbi:hypothetical protein IFR05_010673 [Cadophora sp. M221]|nr:hypothetical protein IFR05_010673 [Cadophora sp. M221]
MAAENPGYASYRSPYGPKYKLQPNFHGWTFKHATKLGMTLGAFGGVAGVFAVFFFAEVPKVRNDIMVKVPIIGQHFVKDIPASDNVSLGAFLIAEIPNDRLGQASQTVWTDEFWAGGGEMQTKYTVPKTALM